MSELPRLLNEQDVANTLDVSIRTLRRWHALRKGPRRVKIGRKIHYRQQAIQDWLDNSEICNAE